VHDPGVRVAPVDDRARREVDGPGSVTGLGDGRRAVRLRDASDGGANEVEIVERRVVVDPELVGALRERFPVELVTLRVVQVDLEARPDRGREHRQRERRAATRRRRVGLPDPEDVVRASACHAHGVDVTAGVLAE